MEIQTAAIRAGGAVSLLRRREGLPVPDRRARRDADVLHGLWDERLFRRRRDVQRQPGRARGQDGADGQAASEITSPAPAYRLVFLDEGRVTPDSYAIQYLMPQWWDPPFVRHADGTNAAFADGHSDYWKYVGKETIDVGKQPNPPHNYKPTTDDGLEDVRRMQTAIWGRVGY